MEVSKFNITGPLLIKPRLFHDERGTFYESYNEPLFHQNGITARFVQDNQSISKKNVLRGLHFQHPPFDQGKLVRVLQGRVFDIAVDIRIGSPTYGRHLKVELSAENQLMFWIPPGFAHGFISLEEDTVFLYKCTNVYHKDAEGGIRWDDSRLNIDWETKHPLVSSKDQELPTFDQLESRFEYAKING